MTPLFNFSNTFPTQRVDSETKNKAEWYANCIDYIISAGVSYNDRTEVELKLNVLHGNIPDSFYKKTLNPYNSSKEKYTRFPATLRNYDIMSDIVRRFVSEYFKGVQEFVVDSNDPQCVINKTAALNQEILKAAIEEFNKTIQENYKKMVENATQQGQDPKSINPQDAIPDQKSFMENFEKNYIDDKSEQAAKVLSYVRAMTDDAILYLTAYFNFVALGECYTYSNVIGDDIVKEAIPVIEAYPIPNSKPYVEDHDMFARKIMMSYEQIIDMFDNTLTDNDRNYLANYYAHGSSMTQVKQLSYNQYFENYPDLCSRFSTEERNLFKSQPITVYDGNSNLYEVWHCVWKGWTQIAIVTYQDRTGQITQRIEDDSYQLNPAIGDIQIDYTFKKTVYEGYRIGARSYAIYPIKARAINYSRNWKLPYNGIMEVLPMMGKFSIIDLVAPYQILRNIISYHREMVIAKNKMLILMLPQSLIASQTEDKIYKMAADGTLIVDDSDDTSGIKMQQVRLLNANMGDYINQLTALIEAIKHDAREIVDMNAQRYGQITQSAGASTTNAAIAQSAMGSVIIETVFDVLRCRDYNRDLDYAKFAYVDGLKRAYTDELGNRKYISLDVDSFIESDYSITVRNSAKEIDKLKQLRQWAFSAAQNGDLEMAMHAITGDNVAQIKSLITQYTQLKQQHEDQLKQADQMLEQAKQQNEIAKIQAKGEVDKEIENLKFQHEMQLKYVDADTALLTDTNVGQDDVKARIQLQQIAEQNKIGIAQQKAALERQKLQADMYNKAADRDVERQRMANDLKIARTNKNRYDK